MAAALLLATGACAAVPDLRNYHTVEEGVLLRSGQPSSLGLAALRDTEGVQTVVSLMTDDTDAEIAAALALGLDYVPVPTRTYGIERESLVLALAAIRQAEAVGRTPVLLHCRSGQDRTGTVVAIYRSREQGWAQDRSISEMDRYRHWTHDVVIPHLPGIARDAMDAPAFWNAVEAATGTVPVIRPVVPWTPDVAPPASVGLPARVTSEPGVL